MQALKQFFCFLPIFLALIKISYSQDVPINNCTVICEPEQEFPKPFNDTDVTTTQKFVELMDLLQTKTFETVFKKSCPTNESIEFIVDHNSDIIWDLRFEIYNQRSNKVGLTINHCFCTVTDCDTELKQCLDEARQEMINDINNFWDLRLEKEYEKWESNGCSYLPK